MFDIGSYQEPMSNDSKSSKAFKDILKWLAILPIPRVTSTTALNDEFYKGHILIDILKLYFPGAKSLFYHQGEEKTDRAMWEYLNKDVFREVLHIEF
jgi:hypothetical protein